MEWKIKKNGQTQPWLVVSNTEIRGWSPPKTQSESFALMNNITYWNVPHFQTQVGTFGHAFRLLRIVVGTFRMSVHVLLWGEVHEKNTHRLHTTAHLRLLYQRSSTTHYAPHTAAAAVSAESRGPQKEKSYVLHPCTSSYKNCFPCCSHGCGQEHSSTHTLVDGRPPDTTKTTDQTHFVLSVGNATFACQLAM